MALFLSLIVKCLWNMSMYAYLHKLLDKSIVLVLRTLTNIASVMVAWLSTWFFRRSSCLGKREQITCLLILSCAMRSIFWHPSVLLRNFVVSSTK
jgi:hypothetical protein